MAEERHPAASRRYLRLAKEFRNKEFRDTYVAAHTRRFLAWQMRKFRGALSQTEFARLLDKRQTIVSRLENPNYSGWTLGTLLEIANKLNVGVLVRFVDFPTFMKGTDDQSEAALHPASYDQQQIDDFARSKAEEELQRVLDFIFRKEPEKAERDEERRRSLADQSLKDDSASREQSDHRGEIPKSDLERAAIDFQRPKSEDSSNYAIS